MDPRHKYRSSTTSPKGDFFGTGCLVIFGLLFGSIGAFFVFLSLAPGVQGSTGAKFGGFFMGTVFALIGYGMAVGALFGKQLNRKKRATQLLSPPFLESKYFPRPIKTTPGPRGGHLLKTSAITGNHILPMVVFSVIWNGIVVITAVAMISTSQRDTVPLVFVGVFGVVGLIILIATIRRALRRLSTGTAQLEVESSLYHIGDTVSGRLYFSKEYVIQKLIVSVVCIERVRYGHGTKARYQSDQVFSREVFSADHVTTKLGIPDAEIAFEVTPDKMHSFHSSNNEIFWLIRVEAIRDKAADLKQDFGITIAPRRAT